MEFRCLLITWSRICEVYNQLSFRWCVRLDVPPRWRRPFGSCRCLPTSRTWREFHVTDRHKYSSPGVTSPSKSLLLFARRTANMASLRLHFVVVVNAICAASRTRSARPIKEALRGYVDSPAWTVELGCRLRLRWGFENYRFSGRLAWSESRLETWKRINLESYFRLNIPPQTMMIFLQRLSTF